VKKKKKRIYGKNSNYDLDRIYSNCIRESYNWTCQVCGYQGQGAEISCAHFIGRRANVVRFYPDNTLAICEVNGCHKKIDSDPAFKVQIWLKVIGQLRLDELRDRFNHMQVSYRSLDKKEMRAHYRRELKKIQKKRAEGDCRPCNVVSWD
jgi:hypothetical protein